MELNNKQDVSEMVFSPPMVPLDIDFNAQNKIKNFKFILDRFLIDIAT